MPNSNAYIARATAQATIINKTSSSVLMGNMLIVKGSKNQIYLSGRDGDNKFSPNWNIDNLVLRPYLTASNVVKGTATAPYNPDLFDPNEYKESIGNYNYIHDIHWYIRDTSGVETEITAGQTGFDFTYNYGTVLCADHRQLVINSNILNPNSTADITCKFSFYDPSSNSYTKQQYEVTILNIQAGTGNSKTVITSINGNELKNSTPEYLELLATFYDDNGEVDIQDQIKTGISNVSCLWYIRDINGNNGWRLLDATQQDAINSNTANEGPMYEVCDVTYNNDTATYEFTKTDVAAGGRGVKIYPDLIDGSNVIKCVITDSTNASYSALEVVYDNSDATRVEIYCTNGKELDESKNIVDTTCKAIVTYQGKLLDDSSNFYNTKFKYFWYKYTFHNDTMVNIYNVVENGKSTLKENPDLTVPMDSGRQLYLPIGSIDKTDRENKIFLDLVDKAEVAAAQARASFYNDLTITENELNAANIINKNAGVDNNLEANLFTAYEIKAYSREDNEE